MPARPSSGKPGLATPTNASRNRRISPFVPSNGSPLPTARPFSPTKATMSPACGSRIPRKSGTPTSLSNGTRATSSTTSPRPALPKPRMVAKSKGASPLDQSKPATPASPTINLDKELPSPPIAQVLNPFSPVKAKRTLVDATVATPKGGKWPIIRPENLQQSEYDTATSETEKDRLKTLSPTDGLRSSDSAEKTRSVEKLDIMRSSSDIGCAISTPNNKALDSPLARKASIRPSTAISSTKISPTAVPPRDSSLPLPNKARSSSGNDIPAPRPPPMKPGSTKWPLLGTSSSPAPLPSTDPHDDGSCGTGSITQLDDDGESVEVTRSFDTYHSTVSQQISRDSPSTKTISDASSVENTKEPGLGPVLTIANDADAVLLGDRTSVPKVPPVPDTVSVKSQESSFSALAGRISLQTMSKISVIKTRSSTPHSTEAGTNGSTPLRITPIRSMQPPRRGSTESGKSSSSPALDEAKGTTFSTHTRPVSSSTSKRLLVVKANAPNPYPWQVRQRLENSNIKLESTRRSSQPQVVPPKAGQILGIRTESPAPDIRTPSQPPKEVPSFCFSEVRNTAANRSNTSPSLIPSASRNHRTLSNRMSSTNSPSGLTPRPGRSKHDRCSPSVLEERQIQQPKPSRAPSTLLGNDAKTISEGAAKIKAKRSFRNLFHKRDIKETLKAPWESGSKRSSITMTGSTIAKRFRNSASFSKTALHREELQHEPEYEPESMPKVSASALQTPGDACAPSPEVVTPANLEVEARSATNLESSYIIGNIIDRVRALPQGSSDRLRGLEIAEVCQTLHNHSQVMIEISLMFSTKAMLNAIEIVKAARIAAEKAKKYARECELHVHTATLQVDRLIRLVESDFDGDGEIMAGIRQLMTVLGLVSDEAMVTAATS